MKKYLIAFVLLAIFAIVNAAPVDVPKKSRFSDLDTTSADGARAQAAICTELIHNIRQFIFMSASLQQNIDAATALAKPVSVHEKNKLKTLTERLKFDNDDYARNCL